MERKKFSGSPCSIARSLDVLGDWWNPLILRECLYGNARFDELQHWLDISRNILTRRLAGLVEEGLLAKVPYQDKPVRYEYQLTDKGHDACLVLIALMLFGERWYFERDKRRFRATDPSSEQATKLSMRQGLAALSGKLRPSRMGRVSR